MAVKKWRGKWYADLQIDGQRVRRVSPTQTKRGAQEYEAELRASLIQQTSGSREPVVESPTVAEFAPEFLLTYSRVNNKLAERSRKENVLRNHIVPFFGNLRLDEITPRRLELFKADRLKKGMKQVSVNKHLGVLKKLLNCAVEWGRLKEVPPIRMLKVPPIDETEWLRPDEAVKLLEAAKGVPKWHAFFFVALRTGMRRGEIFGLHWRDVDFEARRIMVKYTVFNGILESPKGGKSRPVPMSADLAAVLKQWRRWTPGALVFPNMKGKPTKSPATANKALDRVLDGTDIRRVRVHDLRHTFASHLVLQGCSLRVVQKLLGHASIQITERYAHVGEQTFMSAIDRLDQLGVEQPGLNDGV